MMTIMADGRVATEPELKTTQTGKEKVQFRLAVERNWKDQQGNPVVDFYSITSFGKQVVEMVNSGALRRGTELMLVGRGETWKQTTQDGASYQSFSIVANDVQLRGQNVGQTEMYAPAPVGVTAPPAAAPTAPTGVVDPFANL